MKREIKNLKPIHREIARLVVLGYRNNEIMKILKLKSESWLSLVINSPVCQREIERLSEMRDEILMSISDLSEAKQHTREGNDEKLTEVEGT